ncbi:MAG: aldehyde dehydrogenase, partial [Burkholderiales bacterium]
YGETGMQATHTAHGVDLAAMARAAAFASGILVRDAAGVARLRRSIHQDAGPHFAQIKVAAAKDPLVLPPRDGALLKNRFREALLGKGAALQ